MAFSRPFFFIFGTFAIIVAVVVYVNVAPVQQSGPADNIVYAPNNAAGAPDIACNGSFIVTDRTPAPYNPPVNRRGYYLQTNLSTCNQVGTALYMTLFVNLSAFLNPVPDNYTLAAPTLFTNQIHLIFPGAVVTYANVSSSLAGPNNGLTITIFQANMVNVTFLQAQAVFNYVQYAANSLYWNAPVYLLSWNETASSTFGTTGLQPLCALGQSLAPTNSSCSAARTCINWLNSAFCVCNPPLTTWQPGNPHCVPNPCYINYAGTILQNGGCGPKQCTVNWGNPPSNVTCV